MCNDYLHNLVNVNLSLVTKYEFKFLLFPFLNIFQIYECEHVFYNSITLFTLCQTHRWIGDWVGWFPKQEIHYIILIVIMVHSILVFDKRVYYEDPPLSTHAVWNYSQFLHSFLLYCCISYLQK